MSHLNLRLILGVAIMLLLATLAPTAGATPPSDNSVWSAEYFNNITLSGPPALLRGDANIDFFWSEYTSPAPGHVNADHYSVRWIRELYFASAGNWVFTTVNDDGMRVWVDDRITMDAWYDQGPTTHSGKIGLTAGWHVVRVEYYNRTLGGTARVSWALETATGDWTGQYFNNQTLSGSPAFVRHEDAINFDWGAGSPDSRLSPDHFSVRWTSTKYMSVGMWRFTATTDDGVRLWVDGNLLLDEWNDHPATTYSRDIALGSGNHTLKMEYYEKTVFALARLSYDLVSTPPGMWRGQYFNNLTMSGSPAMVRDDPEVDFDWVTGSPGPQVTPDHFSVKWDATRTFSEGNYTISATADDGVRIWIDGAIALDYWYDHPMMTFTSSRHLSSGPHALHVEYYDHMVNAGIKVQITSYQPPSGDIVVDDATVGFEKGGCPSCWLSSSSGIGGHSYWTYNNTGPVPGYNWARWYPYVPNNRNYEVLAYIPAGIASTSNARYWIHHAGQYDLAPRSQAGISNQWLSLGIYYFAGSSDEDVSLTDVTYECFLCRAIVFDAVKLSPR